MFYIPFVLILPVSVYGIGKPHYECGENGRFEYCIDSIPGCIVGCHCHPGYYFDTETKICEPNAKLVQEYRRLYSNLPTRVPEMLLPLNEVDLEPTPTTTNPLDSQVENVAKDNDDLGDWLYNQFFKTIESQVINNTDSTDKPPQTRRSNKEASNKNKKEKKSKSQSKKGKKKDLRRKLLRITEDDSLFESSSGSSDDSSDESDSSDSDSSSSSSEGEKKDDNEKHEHDDKEHGHRKILVINKKPKPPLPSFIFLPNMGTPFFPPIGLAPPPIPMFPLVPVPPMPMPPIFPPPPPPIPITPPCPDKKAETTTKKETEPTTASPTTAATSTKNTETPPTDKSSLRMPSVGKNDMFYRASGSKHGQRKKLLRELQQMKSMQLRKQAHAEAPDAENFDAPFVAEDAMQFRASPEPLPPPPPPPLPPPPPPPPPPREERPENVDFKYLAQLIHKMDNNKQKVPHHKPHAPIIPSRRYGGGLPDDSYHPSENSIYTPPNFEQNRHLESPDETYYTNLGHQIASLIRKIDATGEQRVNIEIERQQTPSPTEDLKLQKFEPSPFFMENSYAPRSYWERTVRSLLKHLQPEDHFYRRKINEDSSLFNLERKVETIATTTRSLSLSDLENVVFLIDKAKSKLKNSGVSTEVPIATTTVNDKSLNINLLPPHPFEHSKLEQKIYEYELRRAIPQQKKINNLQDTQVANKPVNGSEVLKRFIDNNQERDLRGALLHNLQPVSRVDFKNNYNTQKNHHKNNYGLKYLPEFSLENLANLNNKLLKVPSHNHNRNIYRNITLNQHDIANIQAKLYQENIKRNNVPWLGQKLASILSHPEIYRRHHQPIKMKLLPRRHNYQSNKLYVDSNNRYFHNKDSVSMPQRAPARQNGALAPAQYSRTSEPSAYFHHEVQHFDMFENN